MICGFQLLREREKSMKWWSFGVFFWQMVSELFVVLEWDCAFLLAVGPWKMPLLWLHVNPPTGGWILKTDPVSGRIHVPNLDPYPSPPSLDLKTWLPGREETKRLERSQWVQAVPEWVPFSLGGFFFLFWVRAVRSTSGWNHAMSFYVQFVRPAEMNTDLLCCFKQGSFRKSWECLKMGHTGIPPK